MATVEDDLERRLLPKGAIGSADEYWLLASRRATAAKESFAKPAQQHLSLAAIFAARGIQAGERDASRLTLYAEYLQEAQRSRCLPSDLRQVQARRLAKLRRRAGCMEPKILAKKSKRLSNTNACGFMICDEVRWEQFFRDRDDPEQAIREGTALFVQPPDEDCYRIELRILEGGDPLLGTRDLQRFTGEASGMALLQVKSGVLLVAGYQRLDDGDDDPLESISSLRLVTEPGVYAVAMFHLARAGRKESDPESIAIVAVRTENATAANDVPQLKVEGEPVPGLLCLP